eukprot:TRINITY_DN2537_c0_g2_i2.p1 TRINITY_DN2537_c0_g2~~TRINITY_DN2537_c0_g2_i2.p1  ORF type:complete len:628 (+),score=127.26 TRINITY_DN2537_c0_g2_i2:490-2373(+)
MEAVYEGKCMAEYSLSIKVNFIVCGLRHLPTSVTKSLAEVAWRFSDRGVVAFDLAGPEKGFSSKHHKEAFDLLRQKSVNITLHSGEAAGWESVQDSIQWCGAHRLGHGVTLNQNPRLVQLVADRGIAVEACITSNLQTKAILKVTDHPFRKYFDSGIIVVPCTDNPKVSRITLSSEYVLLQENFDLSVEEIVRLIDYGFSASFLSYSEKRRLRAEVLKTCFLTLQNKGFTVAGIINQTSYYDLIGVDLKSITSPKPNYWDSGRVNPAFTLEICKQLPKSDLHLNLDASYDSSLLFRFLNTPEKKEELYNNYGFTFSNEEELLVHLRKDRQVGKLILQTLLQTEEDLLLALSNIFTNADVENVRYIELAVRPETFTKKGLNSEEVLGIVLNNVALLNSQYCGRVMAGVLIYVSTRHDDPVTFYQMAQLAVKHRDRVVGFGVYGSQDIPSIKYFVRTFDYLKANHVNVTFVCGTTGYQSIIEALSIGGARRLSNAFTIHKHPRLWDYLANHTIPIEISFTPALLKSVEEASSYINPVGFFLDKNIPLHICSFRALFNKTSRSQQLLDIISECKLSAASVLKLLSFGFLHTFQRQSERRKLFSAFKCEVEDTLKRNNFSHLYKAHYFLTK